jgi:hypothetical protein
MTGEEKVLLSDPPVRDSFARPAVDKPAPVLEPVTLFDKDNKPVQVAPHEAPGKILSGEYGYSPGTQIPISVNGQIGTVPAENLKMLTGTSAKTVTGHEFAQAKLQRDYGGTVDQALTFGANALDSATLGASNFVAPKGVKEWMAKANEANPNAATAGQVAGIIAPIAADVLTGGAATPIVGADIAATVARLGLRGEQAVEAARLLSLGGKTIGAAEELSGAARLGLRGEETARAAEAILGVEKAAARGVPEGVQKFATAVDAAREAQAPLTLGGVARATPEALLLGPTRMVGKIGATVEHALQGAMGEEATTLLGKLAQKGVPQLAKGATEGAIYSAGSVLGQESLKENPDYFGEKALHAVGYGALLGGALSAGGAMAGAIGKKAIGAVGERLESLSDKHLLKALDRDGRFASEVERLEGGTAGLRDTVMAEGLVRAGMTIEQIAEKTAAARKLTTVARNGVMGHLDDIMRIGNEGVPVARLESAIESLGKTGGALEKMGGGLDREVIDGLKADLRRMSEVQHAPAPRMDAEALAKDAGAITARQAIERNAKPGEVEGLWQKYVEGRQAEAAQQAVAEGRLPDGHLTFKQASEFGNKLYDLALQTTDRAKAKDLRLIEEAYTKVLQGESVLAKERFPQTVREFLKDVPAADRAAYVKNELPRLEADMLAHDEAMAKAFLKEQRIRLADRMAQSSLSRVEAKAPANTISQMFQTGLAGHYGGQALAAAGLSSSLAGAPAALMMGKLGVQAAKRVWEERGAATTAAGLDSLTVMAALEKKTAAVQAEIDSALDSIAERRAASAKSATPALDNIPGKTLSEKYDHAVGEVLKIAASEQTLGHVTDAASRIRKWSVPVADAFERTAINTTSYLVSQLPKPKVLDPNYPNASKSKPTDIEMAQWLRRYEVARNPVGLVKNVAKGVMPTQAEVDAFWVTNPAMAQHVATRLDEQAKSATEVPPFAVQQSVAALTKKGKAVSAQTQSALQSSWGGGDEAKGASKGTFGGGQPGLAKPLNVFGGGGPGKQKY